MIKLENFRKKVEDRCEAKGLLKVYDRLKSLIDESDIQELLQTIQRHTHIFQFALTVKDSQILSQVTRQASEMLNRSQEYAKLSLQY